MVVLDESNLPEYIKTHLQGKLAFATNWNVSDIKKANGGLISSVFRATVDGTNIYLKQAIPRQLNKLKEMLEDIPDDVFIVFSDERQYAEAKALQIAEKGSLPGFVPHLYLHDTENNILVLSEVCGSGGQLLVDSMNIEISLAQAESLGRNIALLANDTYGKVRPLRDKNLERQIRQVKYKYEVGDVWGQIEDEHLKQQARKKAIDFIKESLKINQVLVHGDYQGRNIVVCGDDCATVDFEEAHIGDPIEDIGKLTASYLLRAVYFDRVRYDALRAGKILLNSYFTHLDIPGHPAGLQERLKVMVSGCLLLRIDGISSKWIPWVHDENKKKKVRELAMLILLNETDTLQECIERVGHPGFQLNKYLTL